MYKFLGIGLCVFIGLTQVANAAENEKEQEANWNIFTSEGRDYVWSRAKYNVSETWASDSYDMYIPLYAWHNRLTYDQEHIDKYNENPWGFGIGKYRYDKDGMNYLFEKEPPNRLKKFFANQEILYNHFVQH